MKTKHFVLMKLLIKFINGIKGEMIMNKLGEIIRKITRYALQIVEMQTSGGSRKGEYKALIDMFNKWGTLILG